MRRVPLKHLCITITRGSPPIYSENETGDALAIGQSCQRPDHSFDLRQARWHVGSVPSKGLLHGGEVLVNSTGIGTLGRVALVPDELPATTFIDTHVTMLRFDPERANPRFMAYLLGQPSFALYVEQGLSVGATKQKELNVEALRAHEVHVLPLEEQQRAVMLLDREHDRMNELRRESDAMLLRVAEYCDALISEAVSGNLDATALSMSQRGASDRPAREGERPEVLSA